MTMTNKARVERIVEQASDKEAVCPSDDARAFAVTLLLREHRRIVRLVTKKQTEYGKAHHEADPPRWPRIEAKVEACGEILMALNRKR